jgi:bisanhydrobacterioruberin hydratase
MLIGLGIWIVCENAWLLCRENDSGISSNKQSRKFLGWSICVVAITWSIEWLGVHTGWIFGCYEYHSALQPQISDVPLAIGFSWPTLLLSAAALERQLPSRLQRDSVLHRSLIVAILLLIFDIVLEPGAVKLGYWHWQDGIVPWMNYLSWFGIGWLLAYVTLRLGLWCNKFPRITHHFYVALSIYFGLTYLA